MEGGIDTSVSVPYEYIILCQFQVTFYEVIGLIDRNGSFIIHHESLIVHLKGAPP